MRLAIVTTESLPPFHIPCAGGGARVWGLSEALRREGIPCEFFLHERVRTLLESNALEAFLPGDLTLRFFKPELLNEELAGSDCEAVLFEQWQPLTFLRERLNIPIIVDLPGPLALEYYWRDRENYQRHITQKIKCLSLADYYLCALERQRGYYAAWLAWAGIPPDEDRLAVVPFTMCEMSQSRQGHVTEEPLFFWGGMFWPWQERTSAFRTILDTITRCRKGQLVIAGAPEKNEQSGFDQELLDSYHVTELGFLPFSEYIAELKRSAVAVDLCRSTSERRLASDLRTGTALWAGIPCIVTPHSPWADAIEEYNAGWVLQYEDGKGLQKLTEEIALERGDIVAKRRGARTVSERISSQENISGLLEILKVPIKREPAEPFFESRFAERESLLEDMERELARQRHVNQELQRDLDSIRSKWMFRVYKKLTAWFR